MTDITLLDGSIGQELVKRAPQAPTPLWSTQVMLDHPELVRDVHRIYFETDATIATANSYPLLRNRLTNNGIADQFEALHKAALRIAIDARDAHGSGRVATALGPLGASYRPDLAPVPKDAAREYAEIVALHEAETDLFLIETVSGLRAAEGALMGTVRTRQPVWLCLSTQDGDGHLLRSGEPLADVAPLVDQYAPDAVLVNCTTPEATSKSLDIVKGFNKPFGAYANGFTKIADDFKVVNQVVDALTARADLTPTAYADFAMGWIAQGATIVGGCCEVGPDHITEIARRLRDAGHTIV